MQFSYASSFAAYQSGLTLAKAPCQYTMDKSEVQFSPEDDETTCSARQYFRDALISGIFKSARKQVVIPQQQPIIPDELWVKLHRHMLQEEWKRHKYIATGFIPAIDATDLDIIAMYESM